MAPFILIMDKKSHNYRYIIHIKPVTNNIKLFNAERK